MFFDLVSDDSCSLLFADEICSTVLDAVKFVSLRCRSLLVCKFMSIFNCISFDSCNLANILS